VSLFLFSCEKTVRKYRNLSYINHFTFLNVRSSVSPGFVDTTTAPLPGGFAIFSVRNAIVAGIGKTMTVEAPGGTFMEYLANPLAVVAILVIGTERHKKTSRLIILCQSLKIINRHLMTCKVYVKNLDAMRLYREIFHYKPLSVSPSSYVEMYQVIDRFDYL
jgi:hypothetical protein